MPTYELRLLEDDDRCYTVVGEGCEGSGPDLFTAERMHAHALDRKARGIGRREHEDYAGGPR